ncbi:hypothetical protein DH2020_007281 [Rehmannia glutinosa]|uniref:alcohol dehydrogenase n=1 Tax=Rehmannia glutinosa TaxID=99300 RepID=A0ABR0TXR8_REHGL
MSSTAGQVIKCKAAVAWEAGKPLVIEEVEVAPPQKMEVRLKILFTSLCHTDVYFWEGKAQDSVFPRILGHEAAGIVESVGEGVMELMPGDHVLPVFTGECGDCAHCKSEESNMCSLLRINTDRGVMINDEKPRFSIKGKPIYHFVGTSTFSEYTVVHAGCVAKINPLAPLDKVIAEMTDGGVDRSIECTGNINAMISAFECVHDGWGVAVLVGVPHKDAIFKTPPMNLLNERTLKGTFFGNYKPRSDLPSVVEMYMNKELEVEKFITHEVPFAQINKAFELMLKGEGLRCIIRME